jgi:hypothetical protein
LLLLLAFCVSTLFPNDMTCAAEGPPPATGINVFKQRAILIGAFENRGDPKYDHIGTILETSFEAYARTVIMLTLSEEERAFLEALALREEYAADYAEAGGTIRFTLAPVIGRAAGRFSESRFEGADRSPAVSRGDEERDGGPTAHFPLTISGYYYVRPTEGAVETVVLKASSLNGITGRVDVDYGAELALSSLIAKPELLLVPFFRLFLRYQTHTASFTAVPRDALIYIDEKLVGTGEAKDVLLSRGEHKLSVRRKGYRDYSAIISVIGDNRVTSIELEKPAVTRSLRMFTDPPGAELYIDERYAGTTPTEVALSGDEKVFTLKEEGYADAIIRNGEGLPPEAEELHISLTKVINVEEIYRKAEVHKKRSGLLYGIGIGMLAVTILLGTEKTLFEQESDLYRGTDPARSEEAAKTAETLGYLTAASGVATGVLFTLSFANMVKYFKLSGGKPSAPRKADRSTRR